MKMNQVKGFRFHPTDEEAMEFLWEKQVLGRDSFVQVGDSLVPVITQFKDICKFEPGELPGQSELQSSDNIWYFFCSPRYKYRNSKRKNRVTKKGYWKPTGKTREIVTTCDGKKITRTKQTLVFYIGRVRDNNRKENKTTWAMHELELTLNLPNQKSLTLCILKKKKGKVDVSSGEEGQSNLCLPSNLENQCTNSAIPEGQLNLNEPLTEPVAFTDNSRIRFELITDEFVDSLIKDDDSYINEPTFLYGKEDSNLYSDSQMCNVNTDIPKNQKQKLKAPNGCDWAMNQVGSEQDNSSWSSLLVANDPTKSNGDDNQQNTLFAEEGSSLAFENHVPMDSIPTEGSDFDEFVHSGIKFIAELLLSVPEATKNSDEVHNHQFSTNGQDDGFWNSTVFTTDEVGAYPQLFESKQQNLTTTNQSSTYQP